MDKLIGRYRIYPLSYYFEKTKKCLSVYDNSSDAWSPISVDNYDIQNSSQVFTFEKIGNQFKIVTCYNHQVFDVKEYRMQNGTSVIQYPDNGGGNQHWDIDKVDKQKLSSFLIMLGIDTNIILDMIYSISVSGFQLTVSNDQVIIDSDSHDLYILEKVE